MRRQKSLARDVLVLSSIQADYMLYTKQTLALLALMPLALFAQKDVVSAYNANQDGDYLKAAEFIDKAIEDPKANVKEKTWRYRANIYTNLAADSMLYTQVPDALDKAAESLIKADELDVKQRYTSERQADVARGASIAGNAGITYFNAGVYGRAGELFVTAAEMTQMLGAVDTMAIFNSALCFEKASLTERAIEQYMMCGAYGYQVPEVFLFVANIHKMEGDTAKALTTLQNARGDFPREQALIIEELNIYLVAGEFAVPRVPRELCQCSGVGHGQHVSRRGILIQPRRKARKAGAARRHLGECTQRRGEPLSVPARAHQQEERRGDQRGGVRRPHGGERILGCASRGTAVRHGPRYCWLHLSRAVAGRGPLPRSSTACLSLPLRAPARPAVFARTHGLNRLLASCRH